ncbi:MAG: hypothetical protein AAF653_10260 [Chloroflexota bacterium]
MTEQEYYSVQQVTPELVFIQWHDVPNTNDTANHTWVDDIHHLLMNAAQPQYFFSDVRNGHASNLQAIRRLTQVIQHENYGGGVALGESLASRTYVSLTIKVAGKDDDIYRDRERALSALDAFKPGISATADWDALLG